MIDQPRTAAGQTLLKQLTDTQELDSFVLGSESFAPAILAIEAEATMTSSDTDAVWLLQDVLSALDTEIGLHPYEADVPTKVIKVRDTARRFLATLALAQEDGDASE